MNRSKILTLAGGIALLGALWAPLAAEQAAGGPIRVVLEPVSTKEARGIALLGSDPIETFFVRVFSDLPESTRLTVAVVKDEGKFEVGTLEIVLGSGLLALNSAQHPSPVFPVATVQVIEVGGKRALVRGFVPSR